MSETAETTPQEASPPAPEDPTARYASLLASGERVLLVRRRHWLTFLEAGRWFLLALGAAILSGALDSQVGNGGVSGVLSTVLGWATGVFLAIGVLGVGWYVIVWRVERYLVTTRRVIETGGVINKWSRDTSLEMITDMIVDHPFLGRIFGYGEIDLLTASEQGENKIRFLPDPDNFKKALLDAKQEHALELAVGARAVLEAPASPEPAPSAPAPAAAPEPEKPAHASAEEVDASLTRLAGMRDRGLITQAEFDEKKKQLLDRI
jgi:PH (Pleckstrin Homology) domain-containing protein/putative oligomerization/nucleic acid binding protein